MTDGRQHLSRVAVLRRSSSRACRRVAGVLQRPIVLSKPKMTIWTSTQLSRACSPRWARRGWLQARVPAAFGGSTDPLDVRTLCLDARDCWRYHDGLADFAFAMQGLGSRHDLALRHRRAQKRVTCRTWRAAGRSAAFALSEPTPAPMWPRIQTTARARRRRLRARWHQDLDLQRRHRRLLRRVRAHRRSAGGTRPHAPSSSMPTRPASRSLSGST